MDIIYLGVAALFLVMTLGLARVCERLAEKPAGEKK